MKKKIEPLIGIKKAEKKESAGRGKKPVTLFFRECVEVYFKFYEKEFGLKPSFDGSAPKDLKTIIDAMQKRSEENGAEWNCELAKKMMKTFLEFSIKEEWLKENFLLFNLNRQKDKLFFKIKKYINGQRSSKKGFTREDISDEFNRRNYAERST